MVIYQALELPAPTFSHAVAFGVPIIIEDILELRDAVAAVEVRRPARSLTGNAATYNVGRQSASSRHSLPEELR